MEEAVETLSAYLSSGPNWPYALAQLYEGSSHTPLPKDKHLGILPQGKVEESSYGWISQLEVCQLLSTGPQVVYPVGLNGNDEPVITTLPEPLSSGASITASEHPYMGINIPSPSLEESECKTSPVDKAHTIPTTNSPKTPPKPRISIVTEVNNLLTQAMAEASSCKFKHSPLGKVTTVVAIKSLPQKSEASPQPVITSSQASMEEAEPSLEGLPANISPIAVAYSSGSVSPPVDPMELQANANRAANNMLHLKRPIDLKRKRAIWELGVLLHQSEAHEAASVTKAKAIH